jgi:hypothetical protein
MRKGWMFGAAFAVMMVGAAAVPASEAFASGPSGKTSCSTASGSIGSGFITISGCVDSKGASTGGGTGPESIALLGNGGTITWNSGKTTTFAKPTIVAGNAKKCPGYVKPPKGQTNPNNPTEDKFSGVVTGDTSGMKVPGKYKGDICITHAGAFSELKPMKVS